MAYCEKCKTDLGSQTLEDHSPNCTGETFADKVIQIIEAAQQQKQKKEESKDNSAK